MTLPTAENTSAASHVLWFRSLFREGRALAFACDGEGQVDVDSLAELARDNNLFACTTVGRKFAASTVQSGR